MKCSIEPSTTFPAHPSPTTLPTHPPRCYGETKTDRPLPSYAYHGATLRFCRRRCSPGECGSQGSPDPLRFSLPPPPAPLRLGPVLSRLPHGRVTSARRSVRPRSCGFPVRAPALPPTPPLRHASLRAGISTARHMPYGYRWAPPAFYGWPASSVPPTRRVLRLPGITHAAAT